MSTPVQPIQAKIAATQQAAPASAPAQAAPAPASGSNDSSLPDESDVSGEPVKIQNAYSRLNEKIIDLFDHSGVRRSFTVPYVEGQPTDEHVTAVGQAAQQAGGLTNNLLMSAHHSGGKGWGSGDGHTVAHPADDLRRTLIPKDSEEAKAAVSSAKSFVNQIAKFLGDNEPAIKTAKSQLSIVGAHDGTGMTLLDFGVALTQIVNGPIKAIARAHSGTKDGGHAPQLRAPAEPPQAEQE